MIVQQSLSRTWQFLSGVLVIALIAVGLIALAGTSTAKAQGAPGFAAGQSVVVATDALNLRADATTSGAVIDVLPQATFGVILDGPILGVDYTWYLVQVDSVSGYVAGEFLADAGAVGSLAIGDAVVVNTDALNLRTGPSLSTATIFVLATGAAGIVLDGPVDADGYAWYQLDIGGLTGWVVRDYLAYGVNSSLDAAVGAVTAGTLYVNTDALNVRDTPGLTGDVLETLIEGEAVTGTGSSLVADGYTWTQVLTAAGATGWVAADFLTISPTDLLLTVGAEAFVDTDALNLRATPSLSGVIISTLLTGESVTITGPSEAVDGYLWYPVDTAAGSGWVVDLYLGI